ncbi:hypothetical protein ABIA52_003498 [Paenarthrobacter histidinolovorans]|uniref:Uncharacterized protein n=1 Tax=Paenarthrobacter histidinolovorans TaxID=43664 RepID=A0ABW8NAN0_9MICC
MRPSTGSIVPLILAPLPHTPPPSTNPSLTPHLHPVLNTFKKVQY